ncbi:MAG: hypothetical protein ACTHU0_02930 [Kofleriaceae bacterium]
MRASRAFFLSIAALAACGDDGGNHTFPDAPPAPACSDGIDNDGDGKIDFPDDPGCSSSSSDDEDGQVRPQCNDGRDNDGDGKMDFPLDPGCSSALEDDESDDCPDGPGCPQCSNGVDDDANGKTDYPNDPGCSSAGDETEFDENAAACGPNLDVEQLPASGMVTGVLDGTSYSLITSPCGGGGGAAAIAYAIQLTAPKVVVASTDHPGTALDTVIDIRSAMCKEESAHMACGDDVDEDNEKSTVAVSLQPGTYYVIVEGYDATQSGAFTLSVQQLTGEGTACTTNGDCGPGLVCRIPLGQTAMVCSKPVCSDGADDDSDGKTDFPDDPGCTSPSDDTEEDDCPDGPNCPQCSDGIDNDMNGATDYPDDNTCSAASDNSEGCSSTEPVTTLTMPITTGNTDTATHDVVPSCSLSSSTAPDRTYRLVLPTLSELNIYTDSDFDAVTALYGSTCGGVDIECSDPGEIELTNMTAGVYYLVVDGWGSGSGEFTLDISGKIPNGGLCESPLTDSGAFQCGTGYACTGPVGAKTCQPAECSDGIDNNGDGKVDYPNDPGCASPNDASEDTVCPGASCPVCSNGADDDSDMMTDFPADYGCSSAGGTSEVFCPIDPNMGGVISAPITNGTLAGIADNYDQSCQSTTANDIVYSLQLPVPVATLVIDTNNSTISDTVLSLRDAQCGAELACDDDAGDGYLSMITMTDIAAGNYAIVVDSYQPVTGDNNGPFTLNVKGTVAAGTACTSPLFTSGVLVCPTGTSCMSGMCQ